MASDDMGDSSDRMDWETNPRLATKPVTTGTGSFAALTELVRFEICSKTQATFKISKPCHFLFLFM